MSAIVCNITSLRKQARVASISRGGTTSWSSAATDKMFDTFTDMDNWLDEMGVEHKKQVGLVLGASLATTQQCITPTRSLQEATIKHMKHVMTSVGLIAESFQATTCAAEVSGGFRLCS